MLWHSVPILISFSIIAIIITSSRCNSKGGIELSQTIKLIAGGSVQGIISFKSAWIYKKLLYGSLFDSSSSEFEDDPGMKPAMVTNLRTDDPVVAQYSVTNSDSDGSSDTLDITRTPSKTVNNKSLMEFF